MAIVQISQITNRKGLQVDLPQLAGAELGWSVDTRQLYIGNGTLAEGAPVIGNTEILTEFSDILNLAASYTYKGTAAGYTVQTGPTPGTPVTISLQNWLDQFASVLDFGAKGDGVTDDTAAINRALNQLYCQQNNPQIRRSLFFPAGVYIVDDSINIPTYATLYGEGPLNSIIQLQTGTSATCVAQTADSRQQTGINIGNNGATPPTDISIFNMAFQSLDDSKNIFLIQSATHCKIQGVSFIGPETTTTLTTDTNNTAGIIFGSAGGLITSNIVVDACRFTGTVYGINTSQHISGITVSNSNFNILYQGVILGTVSTGTGPTGVRITSNLFNNIYYEGIIFGAYTDLNASGYNIFYDVANSFNGTANPSTSVIRIQGNNNVSIGDMFERTDAYSTNYPRVNISQTQSIATTNGTQIELGTKVVKSGLVTTLIDNEVDFVAFTVSVNAIKSFKIDYTINRADSYRTGTMWIASNGIQLLNFMDDYTENSANGDPQITLGASQTGSTVSILYTTVPTTGEDAIMYYSISYFN